MRWIGKKAAGWGGGVLAVLGILAASLVVPALVHVNWPDLEVPLIFVGLAGGLALFAKAAQARGFTAGVLIFGGILALFFCASMAVIHGWGTAVAILTPLAGLGLSIFVGWLIGRPVRQALALDDDEVATMREPYIPPPMVLPGQAMEIYPNWNKVRAIVETHLVVLIVVGCVVWLATREHPLPPRNVSIVVVCAVGAVFALLQIATAIRMLVRRRPAVVLMAEGFIDNATLGASGMGYIRWPEVMGMAPTGNRAQRRLLMLVIDSEAVRGRLSRWQRLQLAVLSATEFGLSPVAIPERLLPMRVEELQEQMEQRIEAAGATVQ